jgi:hypothetical protein
MLFKYPLTIICDFPLTVLLFEAAVYKALIFALSYCWQAMTRTKTRLKSGYTRERTVNSTTITTRFIPTNPQPRTIRLRKLEQDILRNLGIIHNFTVSNAFKPTTNISSDKQALYQRQRYQTIRENCVMATRKVNQALALSDDDAY